MQYLSKAERHEVSIAQSFPPRKLTKVETAVQNLVSAIEWYNLGKSAKDDENEIEGSYGKAIIAERKVKVDEALTAVRKVTNSPDVILNCHRAVDCGEGKDALVAQYPYLQHSDIIYRGKLSGLQRLACSTIHSLQEIEGCALWVRDLIQLCVDLGPYKGDHKFVGNTLTPYVDIRKAVALKQCTPKMFHGHAIPADLQERVDKLFGEETNYTRGMVKEYGLLTYPDLLERFGLEKPKFIDGNLEIFAGGRWAGPVVYKILGEEYEVLNIVFTHYPICSVDDTWSYSFFI